jgi:hypothetical protein
MEPLTVVKCLSDLRISPAIARADLLWPPQMQIQGKAGFR